jgi:hypothetical protein
MGEIKFHTRRQWHNTLMVVWGAPFLLLIGMIVAGYTGRFAVLGVLAATVVIALVVALVRDVDRRCVYRLEKGVLILTNSRDRLEIPLDRISDASLIDRAGARAYIRQRHHDKSRSWFEWRRMAKGFVRFCTVDIGLTTFTFGLGRSVIDRLPNARHDLVLLRLRSGEDLLLSPQYNQDLVDLLSRRFTER